MCGTHPTIRELIDYDAFCGLEPDSAEAAPSLARPVDVDFTITPADLKARMDGGDAPFLLDVREPYEYQIARLPGGALVPLGELLARQGELDPDLEIIVYCHHGIRSANATAYLRSVGFPLARNLVGGIDAWSLTIDPTVPRY